MPGDLRVAGCYPFKGSLYKRPQGVCNVEFEFIHAKSALNPTKSNARFAAVLILARAGIASNPMSGPTCGRHVDLGRDAGQGSQEIQALSPRRRCSFLQLRFRPICGKNLPLFMQVSLIEPPIVAILTRAVRQARASRARGFTALPLRCRPRQPGIFAALTPASRPLFSGLRGTAIGSINHGDLKCTNRSRFSTARPSSGKPSTTWKANSASPAKRSPAGDNAHISPHAPPESPLRALRGAAAGHPPPGHRLP